MSLVSELLARVKHREEKRDVPPTLREDILRSLQRRRAQRRWLLCAAMALAVIGVDAGLVLWLGSPQVSLLAWPALSTAKSGAITNAYSDPGVQPGPDGAPESPPDAASSPTPATPAEPIAPPDPSSLRVPPATRSPSAPTVPSSPRAPAPSELEEPAVLPRQPAVPRTPPANVERLQPGQPALAAEPPGRRSRAPADSAGEERRREPGAVGLVAEENPSGVKNSDWKKTRDAAGTGPPSVQVGTETAEPTREGAAKSVPQAAPARTPKWDRDVHLYQASSSEAAGDFKQALASSRKVLAVEPKNYVVLNNVAGLLVRQGSYDEAIGAAEKALAIKPNHVPSLVNMSIAYAQKGSEAAGEDCVRRALAAEPANPLALKTLAVLLEQRGALDEAGEVYGKLAHGGAVQGYLGMARVAEKRGKTEDAVKVYQAVLLLDRVDPRDRAIATDRLYQLTR